MRYLLTATALLLSLAINAQRSHHQFDPTYPNVHDPVMAKGENGRFYIFSTGMGIGVMSSSDMKTWRMENGVFSVKTQFDKGVDMTFPGNAPLPSWTTDSVRGFRGHIWAPDISYHNGKWHLYYSCSTFGKNGSAIGLVTNKTLDPSSPSFKWEDQGCVIVSHRGKDNYNCIDPNLAPSPGELSGQNISTDSPFGGWGAFGSFWDGIQMMKMESDMKTPMGKPWTVARRYAPANNAKTADAAIEVVGNDTVEAGENAIEAPFIIYRNGWYYLLVSWDYCCRGKNSTYKTVYGRSRNVEGPYYDMEGKDMAMGGGTYLVGPDDRFFGVGHCSAYEFDGQWYFVSHAYDIEKDGQSKLFIRKISFSDDGWMELLPPSLEEDKEKTIITNNNN